MKTLLILLLLLCLSLPGESFAGPESAPAPSAPSDPLVEIQPPKSYTVKKYALLPLEIPAYVFKGVTWPLLQLGKFLEDHPQYFTFEERDWVILPIVEVGGGDGFGGGFFFQYRNLFDKGYRLRAAYQIHTNLDQQALLSLESPPVLYLWDRPFAYKMKVEFRGNPNARFYGIGSGTQESDRTEYGYDRVRGGAQLDYYILNQLRLTLPIEFMTVNSRSANDDDLSIEDVFPRSQVPGFERRLTYFIGGFELTHDTSDSEFTPTRGGIRSFQFLRYQGLGESGFDFNEYFLDLRQYIPLWSPRHVLGLRNAWQFQQATGDSQVPFLLLSELDWKHGLRGFDRGRFRDTSYVLFNAEYRFPVWDFIDGVFFVDTGKVFRPSNDFSFDNWKYTAGGGFNFILRNIVLLNLRAGYGGEGVRVIFRVGPSI